MKINLNFELDESNVADKEKAEEIVVLLTDIRDILAELNSDNVIALLQAVNKKRRRSSK